MRQNLFKHVAPVAISLTAGCAGAVLFALALGKTAPAYLHGGAYAALWIILGGGLLLSCITTLPTRADRSASNPAPWLPSRVAAALFGASVLFFAGSGLGMAIHLFSNLSAGGAGGGVGAAVCAALTCVFALFGAGYTAPLMLYGERHAVTQTLTGLSLLMACLFFTLHLYFETTVPKNASVKLLLSLAFLLAVLYLLSDIRLTLGRAVPAIYALSAFSAGSLCCALSLGGLIHALVTGIFPYGGIAPYVFMLFFFLYIYINLFSTVRARAKMQKDAEDTSLPQDTPDNNEGDEL